MDSEAQMQLLFAELKRIEGQQQQLKSAVAQNRVLVVHPPKGFHAESVEDEYAEEKEVKPDPDRFIPSGGKQLRADCSETTRLALHVPSSHHNDSTVMNKMPTIDMPKSGD